MNRAIKDREDLYKEVKAGKLVGAYEKVRVAVESSAAEVEQYPSTPYSEQNANKLTSQAKALRILGDELREWHLFMFPDKKL